MTPREKTALRHLSVLRRDVPEGVDRVGASYKELGEAIQEAHPSTKPRTARRFPQRTGEMVARALERKGLVSVGRFFRYRDVSINENGVLFLAHEAEGIEI